MNQLSTVERPRRREYSVEFKAHESPSTTHMYVEADLAAYFSPSWTAFQAERGRDFSVIVDGISN